MTERRLAKLAQEERARDLELARDALQHAQKLEAVGKLTGGVAHDFNNVLHIIGGNLQLLTMTQRLDERVARRVSVMQTAVEKGARLSAQLLAFARRQPLQPTIVNLRDVMAGFDGLLQPALGERHALRYAIADELWNIVVDVGQLENVLINLVINARDAMAGGGEVVIALSNQVVPAGFARTDLPAGSYVRLSVSDTGCGMDEQVSALAFEPFFTTKPVGQGTGLGLSMAYGFVKQSDGHIGIDSAPGVGTTVQIHFPRSEEAATVVALPAVNPARGGSETILVVEDDAAVRATVVAMLVQYGYTILQAEDGESGARLLRNASHVDLLFTDVVMPGPLSSIALAKQAWELFPNIAVLYTSGYTRDALGKEGRLEPGVNLIAKPYRTEHLAQKIREVLHDAKQRSIP
jgi:nitrogen-specific signal transduction histidine kinase